jgi:hypothetical protein
MPVKYEVLYKVGLMNAVMPGVVSIAAEIKIISFRTA